MGVAAEDGRALRDDIGEWLIPDGDWSKVAGLVDDAIGAAQHRNLDEVSQAVARLGRLREGEGMVGFATAFLAAGACHLLLSLWPMRDAPMARVMTAFYAELQRGCGPAAALWRAKRAVRRSHPYTYADEATWAGFVIVGADPAPSLHA